jgi:hypothetical protein
MHIFHRAFRFLFCLFFVAGPALAEEGMWPPSLISQALFDQMRAKGFLLKPEDIYSTNQPSMKDAVVLFGRGCTGELISGQGLILTNHHCGHDQIQSHSSLEKDYLKDGFWAKSQSDELPNPGLSVSFLVRMEDVTAQAYAGISGGSASKESARLMEANVRKTADIRPSSNHFLGAFSNGSWSMRFSRMSVW